MRKFLLSCLLAFIFVWAHGQVNTGKRGEFTEIKPDAGTLAAQIQEDKTTPENTKNTILAEGFNEETWPPTGWQNINVGTTPAGSIWSRVTAGTNPTVTTQEGAGMARYACYNFSSGHNAILVSPALDIPANYVVEFWMYRDNGYSTTADKVEVYTNTEASLTGATLLGTVHRSRSLAPVVAADGWYKYQLLLPAGDASHVIFRGMSAYGNNIFLDNVTVKEGQTNELEVHSLTVSPWPVYNGYTAQFSVKVKNQGVAPTSNTLSFKLDGSLVGSAIPVGPLAPGEEATFNVQYTATTVGSFTLTAEILDDNNNANNIASTPFQVYTPGALVEGFEAVPPFGWTVPDNWIGWNQTFAPPFSGNQAIAFVGQSPYESAVLSTPKVNIQVGDHLKYYARFVNGTAPVTYIQVMYSANGTDWTSFGDEVALTTTYTQYSVDLSTLASKGNFYLGFKARSTYVNPGFTSYAIIDHVTGPVVVAETNDLAALRMNYPQNFVTVGQTATLKTTIKNVGFNTQTGREVTFKQGETVLATVSVPTLNYNEEVEVTTNWTAVGGRHAFTAELNTDDNTANNTAATQGVVVVEGQLFQGFEGTWPPAGWAPETGWMNWTQTWSSQWEGVKSAACGNSAGFSNVKLRTPRLFIADGDELNFYGTVGNGIAGQPTTIQVMYSANGTDWTNIGPLFNLTPEMTLYTVDLSTIPGAYYLAFAASGSPSGATWSTWAIIDHVVAPKQAYEVNFTVKQGLDPLEGASVTVGTTTVLTNASGNALFYLGAGNYTYSVSAIGFIPVNNVAFEVTNENLNIQVAMELEPDVVVLWDFNDSNHIADGGIAANLTKVLDREAGSTGVITWPAGQGGGTGNQSLSTTIWTNGDGTKYYHAEFTTQGYQNLKVSSYQQSSNTGPKDFKLQYKVGEGAWTDVENGTITVANNFTSGVLLNLPLPEAMEDKASVSLRWIMTSNTSVGGATVADGGTSRIDNVKITGYPKTDLNIVSITSTFPLIKVASGTAFNALTLPAQATVLLSDGSSTDLDITWAEGTYNPSLAGTYTLTGTLVLTEGILNPNDLTTSVQVQVINVLQTIVEDFNATTGSALPAGWSGNFGTNASGGVDGSRRLTRNLYGTTTFLTGNFTLPAVNAGSAPTISVQYRAVNYTGYATNPVATPGTFFTFTVSVSTDFGTTFVPVLTVNADNHVESTSYAPLLPIDLAPFANEILVFKVEATKLDGDFYLDFDNFFIGTFDTPAITMAPTTIEMGYILVGNSNAQTFTLKNTGGGTLTIADGGIAVIGDDAAEFAVSGVTYPINLNFLEEAPFTLTFTPASAGFKDADLQITSNALGSPKLDSIRAEGYTPLPAFVENFEPITTPNLPKGWRGHVGGTGSFVRTTTAGTPFSAPNQLQLLVGSTLADAMAIAVTPKVTNVASNQISFYTKMGLSTQTGTLEVGIMSDPNDTSTYVAKATINVTGGYVRHNVFVGEGGGKTDTYIAFRHVPTTASRTIYIDNVEWEAIPALPIFTISPTSKDFGTLAIGLTSAAQTFTVSNTGVGTLTIAEGGIVLTGAGAANFNLDISALTFPINLEANEFFTFTAAFVPQAVGALAANIQITDNLTKTVHNVPLTGIGYDPTLTPELVQNFNGATFPPADWLRFTGLLGETSTLTPITSGWNQGAFANATAGSPSARLNIWSTTIRHWLVTPPINLGDGTQKYQMEFDLALTPYSGTTAATLGADDRFDVVVSTDNGLTWSNANVLRNWNANTPISNVGEHVIIDLAPYTGVVRFGFYGESTVSNADNYVFVDNFEVKNRGTGYDVDFVVTNAATTTPVAGAVIQIGAMSQTTDASGEAGFNLLPGTYNYTITANNYMISSGSVTVVDQAQTLNIALTPYYTVTFNVTDQDNAPITDAVVTFNGVVNAAGDYVIENVVPGTYDYSVTKLGYLPASGQTSVVNQDVTVAVTLEETTLFSVTFIVNDAANAPIADAVVTLDGVTNAAGDYVFENLIVGTYDYSVTKADYVTATGSVTITNANVTVTVVLQDDIQDPFNLMVEVIGQDALFSWNTENEPFFEDFEGFADFATDLSPWTAITLNTSNTYGFTGITFPGSGTPFAYMAFNPSATTPPVTDMSAFSGQRFAANFASTTAPDNSWLITPLVSIGNNYQLSFMVKSFTAQYGLERYKVLVSTTNTQTTSFTQISEGAYLQAPATAWTPVSFDLSAYAGQDIYVAIQCVSNDAFVFMVDDVFIGAAAPKSLINYKVYLDGTEVATTTDLNYTFTNLQPGDYIAGVQAVYTSGSSAIVTEPFTIEGTPVTYNVTFVVKDQNEQLITDAVVTFDGTAQAAGVYVIEEVEAGTYAYSVAKAGYTPSSGNVTVVDQDVTVNVVLNQIINTYTVTFVVEDAEGNDISDAVVTFDGTALNAGEYVISDVAAGTYDYTVARENYLPATGQVTVTDQDVTVNVVLTTSVMDLDGLAGLKVYPNPTSGILYVALGNHTADLMVVNHLGEVVAMVKEAQQTAKLDLSGLAKGSYILRIQSQETVVTSKFNIIK